jgi:hypothetical protein
MLQGFIFSVNLYPQPDFYETIALRPFHVIDNGHHTCRVLPGMQ